jgi:hypothetical protein
VRAKYIKVRGRSANEGSGTAGWSLAVPVPACFLIDEEDIDLPSGSLNKRVAVVHRGLVDRELKLLTPGSKRKLYLPNVLVIL